MFIMKEVNLSSFNSNNVINMSYMFYKCSSMEKINLLSFNTLNVTNMSYMFSGCSSLKEINLLSFNTNNVTDLTNIFDELPMLCKVLTEDSKLIEILKKLGKCNIF